MLSTACTLAGVNPGGWGVPDSEGVLLIRSSSGAGDGVKPLWYESGEKGLLCSGCKPVRLESGCRPGGGGCGGGLCTAGMGLEMELVVTVFSPGRWLMSCSTCGATNWLIAPVGSRGASGAM